MSTNIILLGVLFLGGFVGFLLGLVVLSTEKLSLKLAVSVVGSALGGAPVLFMGELSHEKWMYPIGLVVGFLWVRLISARQAIGRRPKSADRPNWLIAWLDTIGILLVTTGVVLASAFITATEAPLPTKKLPSGAPTASESTPAEVSPQPGIKPGSCPQRHLVQAYTTGGDGRVSKSFTCPDDMIVVPGSGGCYRTSESFGQLKRSELIGNNTWTCVWDPQPVGVGLWVEMSCMCPP